MYFRRSWNNQPQLPHRITVRAYIPVSFAQMMTANSLAICLVKLGKNEAALACLTSYLANHSVGKLTYSFACALIPVQLLAGVHYIHKLL